MLKVAVLYMPGLWWHCNVATGKNKRQQDMECKTLVKKTQEDKERVG